MYVSWGIVNIEHFNLKMVATFGNQAMIRCGLPLSMGKYSLILKMPSPHDSIALRLHNIRDRIP